MSTGPQEQPVRGCPRGKLRSPELCQNVTPRFWYDPRGGFEKSPDSCPYFPQGQHGPASGWKAMEGHEVSYPAVRTPLVIGPSVLVLPPLCSLPLLLAPLHPFLPPLCVFPKICSSHCSFWSTPVEKSLFTTLPWKPTSQFKASFLSSRPYFQVPGGQWLLEKIMIQNNS